MRRLPLAEALLPKKPCTVGFGTMNEVSPRERYCSACERHVVDVSKLTRAEAMALVARRARGEEICVHLEVRESDGAIRVSDGHVVPRPSPSPRVAAVAAASSVVLVACAAPEPNVPVLTPPGAPAPAPIAEGAPPAAPPTPTPPELPDVDPVPPPVAPPTKKAQVKKGTQGAAASSPPIGPQPPVYVDVDGGI